MSKFFDFDALIEALNMRKEKLDEAIEAAQKLRSIFEADAAPATNAIKITTRMKPEFGQVKRPYNYWTDQQVEELQELVDKGTDAQTIARHFGRDVKCVFNKINKLKKLNTSSDDEVEESVIPAKNHIGSTAMTKDQIVQLLLNNAFKIERRNGQIIFDGDALTDKELMNLARSLRPDVVLISA